MMHAVVMALRLQTVDSLLATVVTLHLVVMARRLQTVDSLRSTVVTLHLMVMALRLQIVDSLLMAVVTLHLRSSRLIGLSATLGEDGARWPNRWWGSLEFATDTEKTRSLTNSARSCLFCQSEWSTRA